MAAIELMADTEQSNMNNDNTRTSMHVRVFETRASYLSDLMVTPHIRSIYNICGLVVIYLGLQNMLKDYMREGRIYLGARTFKSGFSGFGYAFVCWCFIHFVTLSIFFGFKWWSLLYQRYNSRVSAILRLLNLIALSSYICSQVFVACIAPACVLHYNLQFPIAFALLMETPRLLMKMHSFVYTNVVKTKSKVKLASSEVPAVQLRIAHYLYFLFAPTLIYRDSYPRSVHAHIRWRFVCARLLEVLMVAFTYCFLYESYKVNLQNFGSTKFGVLIVLDKILGMLLPASVMMFTLFYMVLHAVQNCFAELLCFGDRLFYKDWWTASNYEAYFRKWNCVVHDWLYEYVYKDFYGHVCKESRLCASLVVLTISAAVHEYILGFSLQLFFPVIYFFFGILGFISILVTRLLPPRCGNIFIWCSLLFGSSAVLTLYSMEFYAKQNCMKVYETWFDYIAPTLLTCYKMYK